MLSENWQLVLVLAASSCKNYMRLAAFKLYLHRRQAHATWIKSSVICLRLVATRVQFACDWQLLRYNLNATGRPGRMQFLHMNDSHPDTICLRQAARCTLLFLYRLAASRINYKLWRLIRSIFTSIFGLGFACDSVGACSLDAVELYW